MRYINIIIFCQNEAGSPLLVSESDSGRFWLSGLLAWDTDDLSPSSSPDDLSSSSSSSSSASECRVTGLPSVFTNVSAVEEWLEEATNTRL